jgi:hypothetical protein
VLVLRELSTKTLRIFLVYEFCKSFDGEVTGVSRSLRIRSSAYQTFQ